MHIICNKKQIIALIYRKTRLNMEEKIPDAIDLREVFKKIVANKKLFLKTIPVVFVLSCAYILCIPRYYSTATTLAPEIGGSSEMGGLASIASSFGFDLSNMQSADAINPLLYPDLMDDNGFVAALFNIKVQSADGEISTTYYEYLKKHQKHAWWKYPIGWVKKLFAAKEDDGKAGSKFDPYHMSKKDDDIAGLIRKNIALSVDKKNGVITISVQDQDKLICKTIADSTRSQLQKHITEYRTTKSRADMEYYRQLMLDAKQQYDKSRQLYASYSDSNIDPILQSVRLKVTDLENEMQLRYNTYSTMCAQYQAAKAKVQERTPAFTVIQGAAVPIKPAGPKRMLFVIGMCLLASIILCLYSIRDILIRD